MERINWERLAGMIFCIGAGIFLLWGLFRYALPLALPFLIALLLSHLIRPMARRLAGRFRLSEKIWAVVLLLLLLGGTAYLLWASVWRLVSESVSLLERLLSDEDFLHAVENPGDYFEALTSNIAFLRRMEAGEKLAAFREGFNKLVGDLISGLLQSLSSAVPAFAARVAAGVPNALLITVITVVAGFYFCMDGERIGQGFSKLLPKSVSAKIPVWKSKLKNLSWKYLRALLLLLLLTFAQLFLGFSLLGVEYAFLLALIISVVDLLPLLGVSTVLIPWGIVLLVQKRFYMGIGILILNLTVTVVRQILEPRLLGKSFGLHPLAVLAATYGGWRLFGFAGMVLAPLAVLFCKALFAQVLGKKQRGEM